MSFEFKKLSVDSDAGKRDGYATPEEVPGLTGLSTMPSEWISAATSTKIQINGEFCKLYKYKYPGAPYNAYPSGSYFMLRAGGARYYPHSGLTFTRENTYPRFIINTSEGPYSMINTLVSTSNYLVARYRRAGWVHYKNKWYLLFTEIYQHLKFYHSFNLTLSKSSFEVYEPTSSITMSLSCATMSFNVCSTQFNANNPQPTTGTFDSTDKDEIAEKFGIRLPDASYSTIGERDFSCAKNIVEDLGAYHQKPGYSGSYLFAYGVGYYVITVDYMYEALDRPNTTINGYRGLNYSINVTDFPSKVVSIRKKNADPWVVYAGKQAFVGNTSDLFEIIETASNSYKTIVTVLQSSITKGNMSKYVFAETDTLSFTYGYGGQTLSYSSNETPIGLASGDDKFANMTIPMTYDVGDIVKIMDALDYQNGALGYLTYSDGTTVDIRSLEWDGAISFSSEFGEAEHTLTAEDYEFWVQYSLPTKHFGTLTKRVVCSVANSSNIATAEIVGAKTDFKAGETLAFGSGASIKCYDLNGTLQKTIAYEDFNQYITEMPEDYGSVIPEAYHKDGKTTLKFKIFKHVYVDWDIYVTYTSAFSVDASAAKRTYYYDDSDIELETEDLAIVETRHTNTKDGGTVISENEVDPDECTIALEPFELLTGNKVCNVTVDYENELGQSMSANYVVNIVKYEPVGIEISGGSDSTTYYDNDDDKFHYPTGLTFKRRYSDDTMETISNLSTLRFYRDEGLVNRLLATETIIRKSEGTRIYVYDPVTDVSGYYIIGFVADEITNVYLDNNVSFTLGNRLNPFRDNFTILALHSSGIISEVDDFKFVDQGLIMASQAIKIVADGREWTLSSTKITFVSPTIDQMVIQLGTFKTNYTNTVDAVDCSSISVSLTYTDAEYVQQLAFSSDNTVSDGEFHISNATEDGDGNKPFISYVFDGSTAVNVGMGSYSELTFPLTVSAVSHFDDQETKTGTINIKVFEILDITGIHIDRVYGNYSVGDTFLNEDDTTTATIYYKDANDVSKKMTVNLNSGFSVLNIYPPKGTEFTKIASSRTVKVTSVTNYNVTAEYEISVAAKYVYGNTKTHSIVAVKKAGNYTLPNGQTVADKYLLIARVDGDGIENTEINSSGARVLATGKTIADVEVFGYIDDTFDRGKNGRVILFEDYIPPVDGANNITVTFPCYVPGNADKINKCHFGILFGNNNAKNRLFLSGNPDVPNCDWHSAAIGVDNLDDETMVNGNFAYFEDTSYCYYGETDNKVIGYDIVANDRLLVLKDKSDKETTVYFRTPTLVTAIDGSGNAMTGINGETLYQEEFALVKGNNSVAGISPKAVLNFNGDSLFISADNSLVGMDLTGIVGDNQRYANTRSRFIDGDLRDKDLSNAWLWSDNKYLFLCLEEKTYVSHFELKGDSQYEWFVMDVKDIQAIVKTDEGFYYGNSEGRFFRQTEKWSDVSKVFVGEGGGILASEGEADNTVIVSQTTMAKLDPTKQYRFSVIPTGNEDVSYMYYGIGDVSNVQGADATFFVQRSLNALEAVCIVDGARDFDARKRLIALLREDKPIYLNHTRNENTIGCSHGNKLGNYYVPYWLKRFPKDDWLGGDLYKLYDEAGNVVDIAELYRATVCYKLDEEYEVYGMDVDNCSFKLRLEGDELDLVRYADQLYSRAFKAEIKLYENVEAFYITKPYDMGSLDYLKTVWQWTVTNDTGIPSELEITYASNKIPYEDAKTLSKISVDSFSFDFGKMNFAKVDFDKNVVPRTYTNQRVLSHQKFVCFGFKNYEDTNSVLSSMSIVYTIPHASYSGD